jgi:hypothetical protein
MANATKAIKEDLRKTFRPPPNTAKSTTMKPKPSWRYEPANFRGLGTPTEFQPGVVDFSATWFQARRDVSLSEYAMVYLYIVFDMWMQRLVDEMGPSRSLLKPTAIAWMNIMQDTEGDINDLLQIIAPGLHKAGMDAIAQVKEVNSQIENVRMWPSVFSGVSTIVNRKTLAHRDQGGWASCFDILCAAGTYDKAYLDVPDIGAQFCYRPGTVVAICGRVLRHSVPTWSGGERICIAHFMRANVHSRLQVKHSPWVTLGDFKADICKGFWHRAHFGSKEVPRFDSQGQ